MSASPAEPPRLAIKGVDHAFGGVHAVADVDLDFRGGEICALLGENGAGKSTLMKAVAGALRPDRGEVLLDGAPLPLGDPGGIRDRGVSLIYQELNLVESLPAYENIALGRESRRGLLVDRERERSEAEALLKDLDADFDPALAVDELPMAQRQLIEVAKALAVNARVLIMDEPTSSLSDREARRLFGIVKRLAGRGVCIIFITHRLDEVAELADRVVVMRDGAVVADGPSGELSEPDLIKSMVGRPLDRQFPEHQRHPGDVILQLEGLTVPPRVKNVGFELRRGEILVLAGLVGSGRTDVGRALFGIDTLVAGRLRVDGRAGRFCHPPDALRGRRSGFLERRSSQFHLGDDCAHRHRLPLDRQHPRQQTIHGRRHFHGHLVCDHLDERIELLHPIAHRPQPPADDSFRHRLTDLRQSHLVRHTGTGLHPLAPALQRRRFNTPRAAASHPQSSPATA